MRSFVGRWKLVSGLVYTRAFVLTTTQCVDSARLFAFPSVFLFLVGWLVGEQHRLGAWCFFCLWIPRLLFFFPLVPLPGFGLSSHRGLSISTDLFLRQGLW